MCRDEKLHVFQLNEPKHRFVILLLGANTSNIIQGALSTFLIARKMGGLNRLRYITVRDIYLICFFLTISCLRFALF